MVYFVRKVGASGDTVIDQKLWTTTKNYSLVVYWTYYIHIKPIKRWISSTIKDQVMKSTHKSQLQRYYILHQWDTCVINTSRGNNLNMLTGYDNCCCHERCNDNFWPRHKILIQIVYYFYEHILMKNLKMLSKRKKVQLAFIYGLVQKYAYFKI